ncbi:T-cell-specific guanine nucleotide triphosphate-binding protein 2 isoform X3 [Mesocricetus auratus]|uniref:T-cell-specific guanine nucleotide triphosphate-binding protein 2 isoform X1 n=1 Tax=Mesocricetus auratus TaxID=10036 RepID=A0A1U8C334_MESAU|nr:T-cell-specific guanine nucleotide triphosphate-binding protein 2 isoform X1 [Mesocricetus auratus]XP_040604437.1 T-cell-specific guanine nucleotide triphosphate-binding protein 2 isoform X2 [Mesocricetus auratus]XP_040604438.1 T-cell-specific guanine nucleotide triphosphate-binding protein 2 isoform X3 [Mesocricetus auratus]
MDQFISAFLKDPSGKNLQKLAVEFLPHYSTLISKAGGILSPETLSCIQKALQEGKLSDMVNQIKETLAVAEKASLEIAIIGESGAGKSSFINALRGLSHEAEGSASVGVVETTVHRTPYQHPKYPQVIFWDLPGTGTPNFRPDIYLEKVGFASYDFFIIISSSRFSLNDAVLAQKIKDVGKKFYFVRTKVDSDLYNEEKTKPMTFQKKRVLQEIRDYCLANLSHIGVSELRVFLISNFDLADFDFPKLEETLLMELPEHKRHRFAMLLPNISDASIEIKKCFLKEKIWLEALKSAAMSFIPFMPFLIGFDLPQQEQCLKEYRNYFGLDDKSIEEIAEKLGKSMEDIRGCLKCLDFWSLVKDDSIPAKVIKGTESFCAVKGGPVSSIIQGLKVYILRLKFLDTVADDAKHLMRMI